MKRFFLSMTLLLLPLIGFAQEAQRIAIVDTQTILAAMPETKNMQTELDKLLKEYEDTIVVMQEEFQTKYKEYLDGQETMVESIRLRKEQEIQDLAKRIEDLNQVAQEDLRKKQMELFAPIQQKLINAINQVGNENGYAYILDKSAMIYVGPTGIDATAMVQSKLGL